MIIAFLFAIFFAYLLEEPVSRLQGWFRGSRMAAIAVVYAVFFALLATILVSALPQVTQEAQTLMQQSPQLAMRISSGEIARQVGAERGWSEETMARLQGLLRNLLEGHRN